MVHMIFGMYASPEKHKRFLKWANQEVKYEFEGKTRKGHNQPLVSEIKLYDVRIKKELLEQFMADANISNIDDYKKCDNDYSHNKITLLSIPMKIFRFIFRQKKYIPKKEKLHDHKGWMYGFSIATANDYHENGEEIL